MKQNTILFIAVALMAALVLSVPCKGQRRGTPVNFQVHIFCVDKVQGRRVEMRGKNMQGDTVYIRYGFRSKASARNVKPGDWFTVWADRNDPKCVWVKAEMKLNN